MTLGGPRAQRRRPMRCTGEMITPPYHGDVNDNSVVDGDGVDDNIVMAKPMTSTNCDRSSASSETV